MIVEEVRAESSAIISVFWSFLMTRTTIFYRDKIYIISNTIIH